LRTSARVATALVFVLALSAFAADVSIGCGSQYVYGVVWGKYPATGENNAWMIQVVNEWYSVPEDFYYRAEIGDTVKFDGKDWTIVKTPDTTAPGNQPSDQPPPNIPPSIANPPSQSTTPP